MDEKSALVPSPDEVLKRSLSGAPSIVSWGLTNLYRVFLWVSLPTAFISAVGQLQLVIRWWTNLYEEIPAIVPLLKAGAAVISPVIDKWRDLVRPLREWLFESLPFDPSPVAFDLLLLLLLPLPRFLMVQTSWMLLHPHTRIILREVGPLAVQEIERDTREHEREQGTKIRYLRDSKFEERYPDWLKWLWPTTTYKQVKEGYWWLWFSIFFAGLGVILIGIDYAHRIGWL